jgi:hypothetical protein
LLPLPSPTLSPATLLPTPLPVLLLFPSNLTVCDEEGKGKCGKSNGKGNKEGERKGEGGKRDGDGSKEGSGKGGKDDGGGN